jgi:hypothetical protein
MAWTCQLMAFPPLQSRPRGNGRQNPSHPQAIHRPHKDRLTASRTADAPANAPAHRPATLSPGRPSKVDFEAEARTRTIPSATCPAKVPLQRPLRDARRWVNPPVVLRLSLEATGRTLQSLIPAAVCFCLVAPRTCRLGPSIPLLRTRRRVLDGSPRARSARRRAHSRWNPWVATRSRMRTDH